MDIYQSDSLDLVFKHVAKLHKQAVHALLSGKDIYPGQPPVLRALAERDGQSQKELAEKLQITPATLTVMLGRMEKNGLVERRPDDADQRVSRVYLSAKGRLKHDEMSSFMYEMEALCYENFTMEERIVFRRLLLQMYENLMRADLKPPKPDEAQQ